MSSLLGYSPLQIWKRRFLMKIGVFVRDETTSRVILGACRELKVWGATFFDSPHVSQLPELIAEELLLCDTAVVIMEIVNEADYALLAALMDKSLMIGVIGGDAHQLRRVGSAESDYVRISENMEPASEEISKFLTRCAQSLADFGSKA